MSASPSVDSQQRHRRALQALQISTADRVTGSNSERAPSRAGALSHLGTTVVRDMVSAIVGGDLAVGTFLPPENALAHRFRVSRAVIRESVNRVEEKGLLTVTQGRGTIVRPERSWNHLDEVVLLALVGRRDSTAVLDELEAVRGQVEATMASAAARLRTPDRDAALAEAYWRMSATIDEIGPFADAELRLHELVMEQSENRIAAYMARTLVRVADNACAPAEISRESLLFELEEHLAVIEAIVAGDTEAAATAMNTHVLQAWSRRRPQE